jgi:hypothetical protein
MKALANAKIAEFLGFSPLNITATLAKAEQMFKTSILATSPERLFRKLRSRRAA